MARYLVEVHIRGVGISRRGPVQADSKEAAAEWAIRGEKYASVGHISRLPDDAAVFSDDHSRVCGDWKAGG